LRKFLPSISLRENSLSGQALASRQQAIASSASQATFLL
jgi:hypothetical protein